jgi:CSLREA domain-containing protein
MKILISTATAVGSVLLLACAATQAATFNIADGDVASLKSAITTANSNGQDDTINLAAKGTYTLIATNANGTQDALPAIVNDGGHFLTINGNGATITRSSGLGVGAFRIFEINGATVSIFGVTISNALLNNCSTLADCQGAGLSVTAGAVTLSNCNFLGNKVSGNPTSAVSGQGGAIYARSGTLTVTNCYLNNNSATLGTLPGGGALKSDSATVTVSNSTFSQNTTDGSGGAIFSFLTVTVINSTITNNVATTGGGLSSGGGSLTLVNDTISGNSLNVSGNSKGAGIAYTGKSISLRNTIVAGNIGSQDPDLFSTDGSSAVTSNGHNLIGATDGSSGWVPSDLTGTSAQPLNPLLGPLQDNGGPTQTMALPADSPALDAGDDSVLGAPLNLTSDERGFPRKSRNHVDIGAFELDDVQTGNTFTVTTTSDESDGICGVIRCTLRDALIAVNAAAGGETVQFAPGVSGTITLTHGTLTIKKAVTVIGPGARVLAVDANLATRVLDINASGFMVAISGLTFTRGQVIAASGESVQGGGIYNRANTNTTLTNCTISGSSVISDAGQFASGGGIYSDGPLTLVGCTVSANSAIGGSFPTNGNSVATGGTGEGGGILSTGPLTLQNCTFNANIAQGGRGGHNPLLGSGHGGAGGDGHGGAILYDGKGGMTATNCTVSGNFALGGPGGTGKTNGPNGVAEGGGVEHGNTFSNVLVGNMLIAGNTGADNGPDIFGSFTSNGFNLIGKADGGGGFIGTDKTGTIVNPLDPKTGSLTNNGGQTDTIALLTGSPAIDAGNDAKAPLTDQRGASRVGVSDIGAFEFSGVPPPATTLANISTRLLVGTGDNVLIGGFIVTGTQSKKVIIRAIGPSLPLGGVLADPTLELYQGATLLESNDNWMDSPNKQAIIDSTIPPNNPLESAIVRSVPPGNYTAIERGVNNGTGIGVVEAYDLDTSANSKLANISTRGLVQTGDNVLFAGTIVVGQASQKVIIRALGPSTGVPGAMADPTLELHDSNGALLEANDNWVDSPNKQAIIDSTIPPPNNAESAIVRILTPGNYTAIVRGVNNSTGIAVVEVYALN